MHGHHPGEIKLSIYSSTAGDEDAKKLLKKWKSKGLKEMPKSGQLKTVAHEQTMSWVQ